MTGKLFIVATPIGNLGDTSRRTVEVIESCDFVLAEDTRVTIKLLSHFGLKKRLVSCHEHNEIVRLELLREAFGQEKCVALISDAGTPLVSDPGYKVVQEAIALGAQVIPVPGPSAFLLALVGSGLPCERFVFEGFLPEKSTAQKKRLEELEKDTRTIVFYVSPHKVIKTLSLVRQVFGDRKACIARELTKFYEEFIRGSLSEIEQILSQREILGEFVLVVAGNPVTLEPSEITEEELRRELREQLTAGTSVRDLATQCASRFLVKRSTVYRIALEEEKKMGQLGDEH